MKYSSYNLIHFAYIGFLSLFGLALYFLFRKKSNLIQRAVLLSLVTICAIFEFYDMFQYIQRDWKTIFFNLPLYACDLNIFILSFILLRRRTDDVWTKYLFYLTIPGAFFTIIFPGISNNIYAFNDYIVMSVFVPHALYIIVSILFIAFTKAKIDTKGFLKVYCIISSLCVTIHLINRLLIRFGLYNDANYMFTIHGLEKTPLVILSDLIPIPLLYIVLSYGTLLALEFFIVWLFLKIKRIRDFGKDNE